MRKAPTVALSEEVRERLEKLSRGRSVEVRVAERTTIVLLAAEVLENTEIAARLSASGVTLSGNGERGSSKGAKRRFCMTLPAAVASPTPTPSRRFFA